MTSDLWPPLPYDEWKDTYATLHMWTQIVGKVALAAAPAINHSWGIALHVTPRGLSTRTLTHHGRAFTLEFDFVEHRLDIRVSDGDERTLPLYAVSVADFYGDLTETLREMSLPAKVWSMPVEIPVPIRFEQDTQHRTYDPEQATRLWRILVQVHRVFTASRCAFIGKVSPVHFFWGAFDLAVTRFSGRRAPPREGPAFMRDAYFARSHQSRLLARRRPLA